jgi:hypothetical protein
MLTILSEKLGGLDVRELVMQAENYQASHMSDNRPSPDDLAAKYAINEQLAIPEPQSILIFDDTLISGSHYKAMVKVLNKRFPVTCPLFLNHS